MGVLLLWTGVKVGALTYAYVRYGNCGDANAAKPEENVETTSVGGEALKSCLLYTSPSPRDATLSRMPSSA